MSKDKAYIPALRYNWLTAVYDPVLRWTMRESTFKAQLVRQAGIERGHRVLDLGCGTATLTLLMKQTCPDADVVGLDIDSRILQIAQAKVVKSGFPIKLDQGSADRLPHPDGSFDRVVSSLVLHHLTRENKLRALGEIWRVLRPRGELHVADFGKPQNALMQFISLIVRYFEEAGDNIQGLLPEFFTEVGFVDVQESARFMTVMGTISLYRARKPNRAG